MNKEDLISKYFENTLSNENQQEFDDLLENDKDFAQDVAFQINLKKAITLNERSTLKQKLQSFEAEKNQKKTFKWQYIAASVAILIGSFWFFNQNSNSQQLYNQYYQTYPNTVAPVVRGENSNDLKTVAFFEYDSGNYNKAYQLFINIYNSENQDYALFYGSLSLIELNRHQEALTLLNRFDATKSNDFTPFVKWFKALSYLKLEQNSEAITLLKELSATQNPLQNQAEELLEKLE